ncbi:MAG: hypothetical protein WAZ21_02520 [Candidatus Saccharimonadales bacterium]
MIIDGLIIGIVATLKTVFGILPSLPPLDPLIASAAEWVITTLEGATFIFYYIFGALFYPILVLTIALLGFEHIYHFVMWVIKKLPIGVK